MARSSGLLRYGTSLGDPRRGRKNKSLAEGLTLGGPEVSWLTAFALDA